MMRSGVALLILLLCVSCQSSRNADADTMFEFVPASSSGIDFENRLTVDPQFNIIQYLYFYNGAGVAAGDINNDGLADLYFTSNQHENKLYLNRGDFNFEDITAKAGVTGAGNWKTGVTMADVNGDGWLDIYVCGVGQYKTFDGFNQLFINNGDLTFSEKAEEYGLFFQGFSSQAAFLDYDNDGDLDMYLLNHSVHSVRSYGHVSLREETDPLAGDRFFRNDLIPSGNAHFTEVTSSSGIYSSQVGYGLGVALSDLNKDGFPDIYVSNDFHENDYLYVNNGNGAFRQELEKSMAHTSRFSMGSDIADVNEDGWNDVITLDMFPSDEQVIKSTAGEDNYEIYQYKLRFGYHQQVSRNALQMNLGRVDSGRLLFSDVAPMAGVASTDWSWSALLADFDNDGGKDLFITNGIVGRPNDLDYINYISSDSAQRLMTDEQLFTKMPSGKVPNVMFRLNANAKKGVQYEDISGSWIGSEPTTSNGAAYADLDNDGDLDLVVNNINAPAFVMKNKGTTSAHSYLKIKLEGGKANRFGVGATVRVFATDSNSIQKVFHREQFTTRGWLSSVDPVVHVGLGKIKQIDSVQVVWPGGMSQMVKQTAVNQTLTLREADASQQWNYNTKKLQPLLMRTSVISYRHQENEFNVMATQRLIPHSISSLGPCLSVGDVNGDKLDDVFIGGGRGQAATIFTQLRSGKFAATRQQALEADSDVENTAASLFDADGDGDLDLMVGGGGNEFADERLRIRLYINNGNGQFKKADASSMPSIYVNTSCLASADVDRDGDIDVFVGGGVVTGKYGISSESYLLVNDGKGHFVPSSSIFQNRKGPDGMAQTAVWADLNKDGFPELLTAGEWMPVQCWVNKNGVLRQERERADFGWWNSILATDMDGDSDIDVIAGNLGWNSRLQVHMNDGASGGNLSNDYVGMFVGDLDANSSLDQILTYARNGVRYPVLSRDQLVKQVPSMKKKYLKYSDYSKATAEDVVGKASVIERRATTFASMYFENIDADKLQVLAKPVSLPYWAQTFPVYAIHAADLNGDGLQDLILGGNDFEVQPELWRQDAGYGLILLGQPGDQKFRALLPEESGFIVKGQVRAIQSVKTASKEQLVLVARNNDSLVVFKKYKP